MCAFLAQSLDDCEAQIQSAKHSITEHLTDTIQVSNQTLTDPGLPAEQREHLTWTIFNCCRKMQLMQS